ncbi:hypothetical protein E2C06_18720 [Dankookia rubra]|uniref:Uncharacterized protein n=1 Tax=Dankookia rubra TaxID=1442381 RepID=A0A4R5QDV6_9PROT|nr:hypothetical protein E2C06_18720 [Dankookia rubra]
MRQLIGRGLERTAELWPDIACAYDWVHRAAHILGNEAGEDATKVQRRFDGLVAAMARHRAKAGSLAGAIEHFGKVTRSYRPGLFHCYAIPDLPRTDNGLEQLFGSQRYHERRATGRKTASPAIVLRGEVRVISAIATRLHPPTARELGRANRTRWADLQRRLAPRHQARILRTRFRRDPKAYLAELEQKACQPALPA